MKEKMPSKIYCDKCGEASFKVFVWFDHYDVKHRLCDKCYHKKLLVVQIDMLEKGQDEIYP